MRVVSVSVCVCVHTRVCMCVCVYIRVCDAITIQERVHGCSNKVFIDLTLLLSFCPDIVHHRPDTSNGIGGSREGHGRTQHQAMLPLQHRGTEGVTDIADHGDRIKPMV